MQGFQQQMEIYKESFYVPNSEKQSKNNSFLQTFYGYGCIWNNSTGKNLEHSITISKKKKNKKKNNAKKLIKY